MDIDGILIKSHEYHILDTETYNFSALFSPFLGTFSSFLTHSLTFTFIYSLSIVSSLCVVLTRFMRCELVSYLNRTDILSNISCISFYYHMTHRRSVARLLEKTKKNENDVCELIRAVLCTPQYQPSIQLIHFREETFVQRIDRICA